MSKNDNSSLIVDKSDKIDKSAEKKIRTKAKANGINTFSLQQGSYIPIVTSTKMNSDTPSYFMAIVSENVYSKDGHHKILIPMGSKIIGNYSALKNNNVPRMLRMVDKIILPNF